MESFIEHQDACNMGHLRQESQTIQPAACLSRTASSPSPSSDTNFSSAAPNNWPALVAPPTLKPVDAIFLVPTDDSNNNTNNDHNLDLKLSTASNGVEGRSNNKGSSTKLQLSIGSFDFGDKKKMLKLDDEKKGGFRGGAGDVREEAREELRVAMAEKAYAEEARQQAKRQIEMAEEEFGNAKRMRQQAQAELDKATALKQAAIKQINSTILEITCQACQKQFQAKAKPTTTTTTTTSAATDHDNYSVAFSYVSSVITTEGEVEKDQSTIIPKPPNN